MTIESNLSSIAKSLELIAAALSAKSAPVATPAAVPVVVATPVVAPVTAPAVVTPVATPEPTPMPALPVFTQAVPVATPAPVVAAAPAFADKSAMMDYVLASYKALGQEKGAKIQDVLNGMGVQNINDVPADRWGELKTGIEALKG